jgi:hypothetical protein
MNGLILHCGAEKVCRVELRLVEMPAGSKSWHPVSHFDAVSLIAQEAEKRELKIVSEEYGLNSSGSKIFG